MNLHICHKFCVLPALHVYVLYESQNKERLFPFTAIGICSRVVSADTTRFSTKHYISAQNADRP
jgi:hypothetical protein